MQVYSDMCCAVPTVYKPMICSCTPFCSVLISTMREGGEGGGALVCLSLFSSDVHTQSSCKCSRVSQ